MIAPGDHEVVFLDRGTLKANLRPPSFAHRWFEYDSCDASEVAHRLGDSTIVITNKAPIDATVLEGAPHLSMIAVAATGVNNVDLEACRARGVVVSNVRGYAATAVPEHALCLMLALRRNLIALRDDVRGGAWSRAPGFCILDHRIQDLADSVVGIVGFGSIGQGTAKLCEGLGMRVLISEHRGRSETRPGRTPFETVLRQADVLSLHCPLTDANQGLIGRDALAAMKPTALVINTARGGLINEAALAEALLAGSIGGAGIDVLSKEPPIQPGALLKLDLPNLLITPHVAWASDQAMQALADQVIDNIEAFVAGTPKNTV